MIKITLYILISCLSNR